MTPDEALPTFGDILDMFPVGPSLELVVDAPAGPSAIQSPQLRTRNLPLASLQQAPPTADFSAESTQGPAPLTVDFFDTSSPEVIDSWLWEFGDGVTDTVQNPTHVYPVTGSYTVSLTVWANGESNTEVKANYITVEDNELDFAACESYTMGPAPLEVEFCLSSGGEESTDPDSVLWGFGDGGSSTSFNPTYAYHTSGTYTVTLTGWYAGYPYTVTKPSYIEVEENDLDFGAWPTSGSTPLPVEFYVAGENQPDSVLWQFGDGGSSGEYAPEYTYYTPGTYTVTLTGWYAGYPYTVTKPSYIGTYQNSFIAEPTVGLFPLTVVFTNTSAPPELIGTVEWDFDDGEGSGQWDTVHSYDDQPGVYQASLTVWPEGGEGASDTTSITITVEGVIASFTATPTIGLRPLTVQFTDTSQSGVGAIDSWAWLKLD
jgi:PKD repeat protein